MYIQACTQHLVRGGSTEELEELSFHTHKYYAFMKLKTNTKFTDGYPVVHYLTEVFLDGGEKRYLQIRQAASVSIELDSVAHSECAKDDLTSSSTSVGSLLLGNTDA